MRVDMPALQRWKAGIIATLESGIATLCRGNKVEVIKGGAEVIDAKRLKIKMRDGLEEEVVAKNLVIATGSRPISLPGLEFDGKLVSAQGKRSTSTRSLRASWSSAEATSASRFAGYTRSSAARSP